MRNNLATHYTLLLGMILLCLGAALLSPGRLAAAEAGESATNAASELPPRKHPWTSSKLVGSPEPPPPYRLVRVFPHLEFSRPVEIVRMPGSNRLVVATNKDAIYSFPQAEATRSADVLFNPAEAIKDFWRTLGMTFDPQFNENRYVYICYTLSEGTPDGTIVSRFTVNESEPPTIDLKSELKLITWVSGGHNGGCLQFGPDGYLYISTGDGSSPNPPDQRSTGQDVSDLLASVLRIDVRRQTAGRNYAVPGDNPFLKLPGARPEVWAYGFRNPWKMCFQPGEPELWVGDVGWELWEMIYRVESGGNYGWSIQEGRQPVRPELTRGPTPLRPPTIDHDHTEARSITGGRFYIGKQNPELANTYVYGDYVTGKFWGLRYEDGKVAWHQHLADSGVRVVGFGEDHNDELLALDYAGGLYQFEASPSVASNQQFPRRLSETGLFSNVAEQRPAPGVLPYWINAEPWADHAVADRFVGIPGNHQLGVYARNDLQIGIVAGEWSYPDGAVFAKTISLETERGNPATRRKVETQVLHRDGETWRAYSYRWNEQQTDAELVDAAGEETVLTIRDADAPGGVRRHTYHFVSRTQCIVCHTTRAGSIHGFNVAQLSRPFPSDVAGHPSPADNQLDSLAALGLFAQSLPEEITRRTNPHDESQPLDERARSYLDVNCGHCHRPGGGGNSPFRLQYGLTVEETKVLGMRPYQGAFGIARAAVVAPGNPQRSVLLYRISKLGRGRMPFLGSGVVDTQGTELIRQWIASLEPPAEQQAEAQLTQAEQQQRQALTALSKTMFPDDQTEAQLDTLLASAAGALQLLQAIDNKALVEPVLSQAISRGAASPDPHVRDLFERFVPEENRVQRLGTVINAAELLVRPGNVERGRELFWKGAGVQCKNCHQVKGQGTEVGPDLTKIGAKLDRAKLLESILEPSKTIDPKYASYVVETTAGKILAGLLVKKNDTGIVLRTAENKLLTLPADEVEFMAPQLKSLMPDLQLRDMTADEVADLLEYLSSLRE